MKSFIGPDFLHETETARRLYHEVAKAQPIIDYHCHLPPDQIAQNHRFRSLTEVWLDGDHYKWRAMRAHGVAEQYCTGDASDWEKFAAWAGTVPATLRNPLYHWTHLELMFPFGIKDRLLNPESARGIYDACNAQLARPEFTTQGLLAQYRVKVVCTTDDPVDSLEHHIAYKSAHAQSTGATRLLPTWRPDGAFAGADLDAYAAWLGKLEATADMSVGTYAELLDALDRRHAFFHSAGCRLSDRGLDIVPDAPCTPERASTLFAKARAKQPLTAQEIDELRWRLLHDLAVLDHKRGWIMQLHIGALRNVNTRMRRALGPNTGFDSIGDAPVAGPLARLLDELDRENQLPKTILYNLNPRDNEVCAALAGSFQDGSVAGKVQYGSAWWFLDQLDGMEKQMNALSNLGLLSHFVGMLTDSRSFLSYSRHDYFRRLLCNLLGNDVRRGYLPDDQALLGGLVQAISFGNARRYFGFDV
ncbi:MAG TPA: glucuronate isomerase [Polyangiaceae bacterium]|nr:glucuronate isomerase [Polyangiaceae bacterium]